MEEPLYAFIFGVNIKILLCNFYLVRIMTSENFKDLIGLSKNKEFGQWLDYTNIEKCQEP